MGAKLRRNYLFLALCGHYMYATLDNRGNLYVSLLYLGCRSHSRTSHQHPRERDEYWRPQDLQKRPAAAQVSRQLIKLSLYLQQLSTDALEACHDFLLIDYLLTACFEALTCALYRKPLFFDEVVNKT